MFPFANGCLSVVNVLGVVMMGFGTAYMTQPSPPVYCSILLWSGVGIALLSAFAQPFVPLIVKSIAK
jgi:hypothetical protein